MDESLDISLIVRMDQISDMLIIISIEVQISCYIMHEN